MNCKIVLSADLSGDYAQFTYPAGDPLIGDLRAAGFEIVRIDLGYTPTPWESR